MGFICRGYLGELVLWVLESSCNRPARPLNRGFSDLTHTMYLPSTPVHTTGLQDGDAFQIQSCPGVHLHLKDKGHFECSRKCKEGWWERWWVARGAQTLKCLHLSVTDCCSLVSDTHTVRMLSAVGPCVCGVFSGQVHQPLNHGLTS